MVQAAFAHAGELDAGAALPLTVSIYGNRESVRAELHDDALISGLRVGEVADMSALLEGEARPLGDLVLVDCAGVDAAVLAALVRLDLRAERTGARLIVATTLAALDDVFACLDRSGAQILVGPSRAERSVALARAIAAASDRRLRDLSEDERLTLLRLTEQVGLMARKLDRLGGDEDGDGAGAFAFNAPRRTFRGPEDGSVALVRNARPSLPDARLVRRIIAQRQARAKFFDASLFADPAWDILLDLTAARVEHTRVSVTSLCIAAAVPPTTALRWIAQMTEAGLLERVEDEADKRRAFIQLTDKAADAMAAYFASLGRSAGSLV
jgi:hypothetical protein